jgi:hypothetical protein
MTVPDSLRESLPNNVATGARWLDENIPEWIDLVDTSKLHMEDECFCVLGQIGKAIAPDDPDGIDYNSFLDGCALPAQWEHLGLTPREACDRGFDLLYQHRFSPAQIDAGYGLLDTLWAQEIASRLDKSWRDPLA